MFLYNKQQEYYNYVHMYVKRMYICTYMYLYKYVHNYVLTYITEDNTYVLTNA